MTEIIAEIGWNHMGDIDLAKQMIKAAADSGADYAKFQTWSVKNLKSGPWDSDGRRQIYEKAELTEAAHGQLKSYCEEMQIKFLTSCFSVKDLDVISQISDEVKIPSTELANTELLQEVNNKFKRAIVSTGTGTEDEVKAAVKIFDKAELVILHCVSAYPCPFENANLPRIEELKKINGDKVGYSGHCQGIFDAVAAFNYDVKVIEKHFTVDHELPGRDNKFAILPHELAELCSYRDAFVELNKHHGLDFQPCEKDSRENYRGRWDG